MRALDRLISFIFSIIILIVSITLILVGLRIVEPRVISDLLSTYVLNENILSEKLFNSITITGIVLLLLSLKTTVFLSLFKVKDRAPISVRGKNGEVQISQDTIINTARSVTLAYENIKDVQARMAKKGSGVVIFEVVQVYVDTNIRELVEAVQEDVKRTIMANIGVNVVDVNIKIRNIFATKKKEEPVAETIEEPKEQAEETTDTPVEENVSDNLETAQDEKVEKKEKKSKKAEKKVLEEAIEKLDDITETTKEETKEEE